MGWNIPAQNGPSRGPTEHPSNTSFRRPTRVCNSNGVSDRYIRFCRATRCAQHTDTHTTLRAAANFAACWTEARWVWTVYYPTASWLRFEPGPFCAWVQHANNSATEPPNSHQYLLFDDDDDDDDDDDIMFVFFWQTWDTTQKNVQYELRKRSVEEFMKSLNSRSLTLPSDSGGRSHNFCYITH